MPLRRNNKPSKKEEGANDVGIRWITPALGGIAVVSLGAAYFGIPTLAPTTYVAPEKTIEAATTTPIKKDEPVATHIDTPTPVRAVYMSQCAAATPSFRTRFKELLDSTELNSVVIDIKDYTGTVAFKSDHPLVEKNAGGEGCRIGNLRDYIKELHEDGIYVIGRITVFQDPNYTTKYPKQSVQSKARPGEPWRDHKGLSFVSVEARPFWEYITALSKESYALGFDELNFDYIRWPSDGNMSDVVYPSGNRAEALEKFFRYLHGELKETGVVTSADLFGMTTTNTDDLYIGQQLERALPYFDYIAPMVYPSHYPSGFRGYQNVNEHPYDIVHFSMKTAAERLRATTTPVNTLDNTRVGTSTPALYTKPVYDIKKLRPWLQDFDYPVPYTPEMVRAQFKATYDTGLDSWMLWDPANTYTKSALSTTTAATRQQQ